ncbi:KAP family NTPase [Nakamurella sp.]|uniref:KAP family NTPase n=1 Tax=Nakamurella sp. TaxID=1869182 RepID=UPI003B3A590A
MTANWNDDPIHNKAEDGLGRAPYAEKAAHLIRNSHSWDSSVVFGLTGPWGSGKSSLIAMIVESLRQQDQDWCVARFTPWSTSDTAGLLSEFYSCLSEAVPRKRGKTFRRALGTLAQVSAPTATLIPFAGGSVAEAIKAGGKILTDSPPWEKAFAEAAATLRDIQTPVLIVADDIDRLQIEELLGLLKVVRLLGRFPGVQYLLAYDEGTIFRALRASLNDDIKAAQQFMEKIVQYPLVVPPLLGYQLIKRLEEGIDAALRAAGRQEVTSRRISAVADVLRNQLTTPRAIDRFIAQLRHHLPMVDVGEIDDVDVTLLTLLRVAFPSVYAQLPQWKPVLLSGHAGKLIYASGGPTFEPADIEPLIADVDSSSHNDAKSLLKELFPKLRAKNDFGLVSDSESFRVCNEDYFDRYFAMSIPAHDVSDRAVQDAVLHALSGDGGYLRSRLLDPEEGKVYLAISKGAASSLPTDRTAEERLALIRILIQCIPEMGQEYGLVFNARDGLVNWAADLIAGLESTNSAEELVRELAVLPTSSALDLWDSVSRRQHLAASTKDWVQSVNRTLIDRAIAAFMESLLLGDSAPFDEPVGRYLHFALTHGAVIELRTRLGQAVESVGAGMSDLAVRMVGLGSYTSRTSGWRMTEFYNDWWDALAPEGDDPIYHSEIDPTVNVHLITWENRRLFIKGRVRRPQRSDATDSTPPPSGEPTE